MSFEWLKKRVFTLQGKFIAIAIACIVGFTIIGSYFLLASQKKLYLRHVMVAGRTLTETASVHFTDVLMNMDIGIHGPGAGSLLLDYYVSDLMKKKRDVLYVFVMDNSGNVLSHSNLEEYGKTYTDTITMEAMKIRDTLAQVVYNERVKTNIVDIATPLGISTKRWGTLRVGISLDGMRMDIEDFKRAVLYISVAFILISLLPVILTAKALSKPIVELSRIMDRVNYGEFEHYLRYKSRRDEIGQLQISFFRMLQRLGKAEIEWYNTFDSITDLVSIHGTDFRIVKANKSLASRLNTTPDKLIGKECYEVFHKMGIPCQYCPHIKTLQTSQPSNLEVYSPTLKGVFLTSTYPLFNETGEMAGTVHIARDITEEKRLQERLIQSEKMAAVGLLVSGIAHEINNPLGGVLNSLYNLSQVKMDSKRREEYMMLMKGGLERIQHTLKSLLDFAQQGSPVNVPSDINEMAEHVFSLLSHTISEKGIRCEKRLSNDIPKLLVDRNKIEQVLMNLAINAIQAMESGGVLIIKTSMDNGFCTISVKDTGKGIPEDILPRIFDPFFTTKGVGEGTGLGLSVSKGIVEQHNGIIEVAASQGEGTTFVVKLPLYGIDIA